MVQCAGAIRGNYHDFLFRRLHMGSTVVLRQMDIRADNARNRRIG